MEKKKLVQLPTPYYNQLILEDLFLLPLSRTLKKLAQQSPAFQKTSILAKVCDPFFHFAFVPFFVCLPVVADLPPRVSSFILLPRFPSL